GVHVEAREGTTESLAAAQDRGPAQPGLESFQGEPFEDTALVPHRHAPLGVVVRAQVVVYGRPGGTGQSVVTGAQGHQRRAGPRRRSARSPRASRPGTGPRRGPAPRRRRPSAWGAGV